LYHDAWIHERQYQERLETYGTYHILVYAMMLIYKAKTENTATNNKMISNGGR
jgi:adenine-specific DNA methylase